MGEQKDDITELALLYAKDIVVTLLTTIIDCLEESLNCMSYAGGSNLKWVLSMTASFVPVTGLFRILNIGTLIPWQDAVIATVTVFVLYCINNVTKSSIDESILKASSAVRRFKERRSETDAR